MCAHAKEKAANLEKLIVLQNESRRVSTRGWRVGCNVSCGGDVSRKIPLFLFVIVQSGHSTLTWRYHPRKPSFLFLRSF
jgi:hypothetical protein